MDKEYISMQIGVLKCSDLIAAIKYQIKCMAPPRTALPSPTMETLGGWGSLYLSHALFTPCSAELKKEFGTLNAPKPHTIARDIIAKTSLNPDWNEVHWRYVCIGSTVGALTNTKISMLSQDDYPPN